MLFTSVTANHTYKLSNFCHLFSHDDKYALYHSLNMNVIYGDHLLGEIVAYFQNLCIPSVVLEKLPQQDESKATTLIERLIQLNILVEEGCDQKYLEQAQTSRPKPHIQTLDLILTWGCNFDCSYCYVIKHSARLAPKIIPLETLKRTIDVFFELSRENIGSREIVFFGGEPLLAKKRVLDTFEYIDKLKASHSTIFVLVTNGSLVDEEFAKILAEHKTFVIISIDGDEYQHNIARKDHRGKNTYTKVRKGYEILTKVGCKTSVCVTVSHHNIEELSNQVINLVQDLSPNDLMVNSCLHSTQTNDYRVNPDRFVDQLIKLICHLRTNGPYLEQVARRLLPFVEQRPVYNYCPAYGNKIVAGPDGSIGFCESFLQLGLHTLKDNRTELIENKDYDMWSKLPALYSPVCQKCPALGVCGGGCKYDAYTWSGELSGNDVYFCQQQKKFLEWMIWDLYNQNKSLMGSEACYWDPTIDQRRKILGLLDDGTKNLVSWR